MVLKEFQKGIIGNFHPVSILYLTHQRKWKHFWRLPCHLVRLGGTCLSSGGCSRDGKEQCNVLMRAQLQERDCLYPYSGSVT